MPYFTALIFMLLLSGCATKEHIKDVKLPKDIPTLWTTIEHNDTLQISNGLLAWIEDENLTTFVNEALRNNPNLYATALRLDAAKEFYKAGHSKQLPSVGATLNGARSNDEFDPLHGANLTQNQYRVNIGVSWEVDIWGRIADERQASAHELHVKELSYRYAQDSLSARVIQAWIELGGIEGSIAIEKERIDTFSQIEHILIERYKHGLGNLDELSTAKSRSQVAKAELHEQTNLKKRTIRKLEVLLGRYPKSAIIAPKTLPKIGIEAIDIPVNTLTKRPDIQAAIENVAASRHYKDASEKAKLPQLNLSANLFRTSTSLGTLGGSENYWSVLGGIFAPLCEGGRLRHEANAASFEANATLKELHATVLEALKECENLLANEQTFSKQIEALILALQAAKHSSDFYEERYQNGIGTLQTVLIAKEEEMALKRQLNDIKTIRLSNRIDLSLAVGTNINSSFRSMNP